MEAVGRVHCEEQEAMHFLIFALHLTIMPVFMPQVNIGEHGQEIVTNAPQWSGLVEHGKEQIPDGVLLEWSTPLG